MNASADLLRELRIERRPGAPTPRRRWSLWLALLAAALAVAVLLSRGGAEPVETAVTRAAAEAAAASVLDASGYVNARRLATVSSKVTGRVAEVLIEEGQRVEEGQLLARLDDRDAQAQVALARAQLAAAESQLAEAQAQRRLAERTLARQRELAARQLVAAASLDSAQAEFDARHARLASLQRSVAVAREQLAVAELALDHTLIRAPFAGVIVAKAAQPGEMISPVSAGGGFTRTGIGTLVDMDSLEVQVDVNEAYIARIRPQMPVEAALNAYPEWKIPGAVIAIIPTADRSKATVKVRIALHSNDPRIVPDMGIRVSFLEPRDDNAPPLRGAWLPERALIGSGDETRLFLLVDGRARQQPVRVAERRDADVRVESLKGGETVLLSPPKGLADGDRVVAKSSKP